MNAAALAALRERLERFHALSKAAEVLHWDMETRMPRPGAASRALQCGAVARAAHEILCAPETRGLVDELGPALSDPGDESEPAALWRWAERETARRARLPAALVEETSRATARAQDVWVEARRRSDFAMFLPELSCVLELKREAARALDDGGDPYDGWLAEFEPGMRAADADRLFAELEPGLAEITARAIARPRRERHPALTGFFAIERQRGLGEAAARLIGFDFSRGLLDESAHPFTSAPALGDVRITTRYDERDPFSNIFTVLHEAGHGLYEQGIDPALADGPLCAGGTMSLHESQSRLWENAIGRGREFWTAFLPRLREAFPSAAGASLDDVLAAVNSARPSLIRVEADELTYGQHVLLRYGLERRLLSGDLRPADLPEAWNAGMRERLGLTPPDDARGVLQDVHWSAGLFGYFPTYLIGNMISIQLYAAALKDRPEIPERLSRGDASPLRGWLRDKVHRHGRRLAAEQVVARACGGPISSRPYLEYLRAKHGA